MAENKGTVVLVAFYNVKALGVRYLETSLRKAGYEVRTIFLKQFNSERPKQITQKELELLCEKIREVKPVLVGLSVMCSLYMETIDKVIATLQKAGIGPLAVGGAFASMDPEYFLKAGIPYVLRLDGEVSIVKLADCMRGEGKLEDVPSMHHMRDGEYIKNPISCICHDLDEYGEPTVHCPDAWLIDNDAATPGDPQRSTLSYEVVASRGCPFNCSYCSDPVLRKLYPKADQKVRTRSVRSVIAELREALKWCKNIAFIHFYDEIFPNLPGLVDEFVVEYKKYINLPFSIWTHPYATKPDVLKKLTSVGLIEVIMGIQSGDPTVRSDIFFRHEKNEDILNAIKCIHESGVFWATYDFILQHAFETVDSMKNSYELVKKMEGRYELQLHSLNFLPNTQIVDLATYAGFYTPEELYVSMHASMEEQFGAFHARLDAKDKVPADIKGELKPGATPETAGDDKDLANGLVVAKRIAEEMNARTQEQKTNDAAAIQMYYDLMYLWQFPVFRKRCLEYEKDVLAHRSEIEADYKKAEKLFRLRYLYKKSMTVIKRRIQRPFN